MIKRIFGDWKFLVTLAVAVAGAAGPFWLWRADQGGKSISLELISQIPLGPSDKDTVPGLQISINGTQLDDPYFSVVKIINSGNKPVPSTDFEAPLEICSTNEQIISGVRVIKKSPKDIDTEINWDKSSAKLKPTLLNPEDTITLSIITSGGRPGFYTKARIIGVSSVPVANTTASSTNPWIKLGLLFVAIAFAIPAMAASWRIEFFEKQKQTITLYRRTVFLIVAVMSMAAMVSCTAFLNTYGVTSFWATWLANMLLFIVALFIGIRLDRSSESNDQIMKL